MYNNDKCVDVNADERDTCLVKVANRVSTLAHETNAMAYAVHASMVGPMPEDTGRREGPTNLKEELLMQADLLENLLKTLRGILRELGM